MKQLYFLLLFLPVCAYSQSVTPEVVGSAGEHFTSGSAQLSWTLGEVAIDSYFGTSNQLTQGFHQPENGLVSIGEVNQLIVNAYPNPFTTDIKIQIPANVNEVSILVYDALGNLVHQESYSGNQPKTIDFSGLATGIYHLNLSSSEGIIDNIKVQKL